MKKKRRAKENKNRQRLQPFACGNAKKNGKQEKKKKRVGPLLQRTKQNRKSRFVRLLLKQIDKGKQTHILALPENMPKKKVSKKKSDSSSKEKS